MVGHCSPDPATCYLDKRHQEADKDKKTHRKSLYACAEVFSLFISHVLASIWVVLQRKRDAADWTAIRGLATPSLRKKCGL